MGFFSKIRDVVGIEEADDDEITEEEIKEAEKKLQSKAPESRNSFTAPRPEIKDTARATTPSAAPSRVNPNTNPFKLVVIEPQSFDECPKLVDNLKSRKPVIINLEKIESDTARKIFDFLSGATYALNGNVQKIANNIFVFAPENVDITASVEHKSMDFNNVKAPWR